MLTVEVKVVALSFAHAREGTVELRTRLSGVVAFGFGTTKADGGEGLV